MRVSCRSQTVQCTGRSGQMRRTCLATWGTASSEPLGTACSTACRRGCAALVRGCGQGLPTLVFTPGRCKLWMRCYMDVVHNLVIAESPTLAASAFSATMMTARPEPTKMNVHRPRACCLEYDVIAKVLCGVRRACMRCGELRIVSTNSCRRRVSVRGHTSPSKTRRRRRPRPRWRRGRKRGRGGRGEEGEADTRFNGTPPASQASVHERECGETNP